MHKPLNNSVQDTSTFRKVITVLASVVILVHLAICTFIIINPKAIVFNSASTTRVYKQYALPGPYFRDDLIKSSPHFYVSGKQNYKWEPWQNPEDDNFKLYHTSYWRYNKLKQSYLERHLASKFCSKVLVNGDSAFTRYAQFKALHKYFYNEYFPSGADSVRLLYTTATYKPRERKTKIDTLFYLKYKP